MTHTPPLSILDGGIKNVFVVDDHSAAREAMSIYLEDAGYEVNTFASAQAFLAFCTEPVQGCLILDMNLPDMDGLTLHDELIRRHLNLSVIYLSGYGTIPATVRAIKTGAVDFLTKPVEGALLLSRVRDALARCLAVQNKRETYLSVSKRLSSLSTREREVMLLAVAGHTSKQIAQRLEISYRTVEIHRAHVMQKTGAENLIELARIVAIAQDNPDLPSG